MASTSEDLILKDLKLEACSSNSELGKISGSAWQQRKSSRTCVEMAEVNQNVTSALTSQLTIKTLRPHCNDRPVSDGRRNNRFNCDHIIVVIIITIIIIKNKEKTVEQGLQCLYMRN